jgi:multidrug efflux pump subunit AcrB
VNRIPNLSRIAVEQRSLTLFFLLLSIVGGVYAFLALGRAEDPAFTVRVMVVSAEWPGATVKELEEQVVDRLEKRIQEVENLYRIETSIRPGRADLQVEFHDYTPSDELPKLFYEVRKRMLDEQPFLPAGVIGPIVNDDFLRRLFQPRVADGSWLADAEPDPRCRRHSRPPAAGRRA